MSTSEISRSVRPPFPRFILYSILSVSLRNKRAKIAVQAQNSSIIKFIDSPYLIKPSQPVKQINQPIAIGISSFFTAQAVPAKARSQFTMTHKSYNMAKAFLLLIDNLRKLLWSFHMLVIAVSKLFPSKRNQIKVCGNVAW